MYCLTSYASPIGLLTLGSDGKHLTGLWIQGQKYFGGENVGEIGKEQGPEPAVFGDARKWLDRYFSGQKPCPDELPLAPEGTEFQKLIWGLLCEIPYGTVTGPQSGFYYYSLSPCGGGRRKPYRICRRSGPEDLAAGP